MPSSGGDFKSIAKSLLTPSLPYIVSYAIAGMQIGQSPTNTLNIFEYVFIPIVLLQFAWRKIQFDPSRVPMIQVSPYEIRMDHEGGVGLLIPVLVNAAISFELGVSRTDIWKGVSKNKTMQGSMGIETLDGARGVNIKPGHNEVYLSLNVTDEFTREFLETRDAVFPSVIFQGMQTGVNMQHRLFEELIGLTLGWKSSCTR
jgi:hypothetical protein